MDAGKIIEQDRKIRDCKAVEMIWTRAQLEHDCLFIPKDIWRIYYSKGLVDFFPPYNDRFNVLLAPQQNTYNE